MEETNNQTVDTETTEITEEVKETKSEKVKEEKTFTQKDFDEALQKEISRKTKGIPSKEELKAFKEWQDNQKTEAEKNAEREKEYQKIVEERDNSQRENLLLRKGVKVDDIDYVMFKVSKQKGDFEDNLEQFIQDNPKFLSSYKEPHKTIDLGGEHTEKQVDSDAEARRIMGLEPKK
jgi:hypothetical protein